VDFDRLVATYVRAWHERDGAARRRLLEQTWAVDGVYEDPGGRIEGREAFDREIAGFQASRPGIRVEVRSAVDAFDRHFRFVWATVEADGTVRREGIDVGQLDDDGRIASLIAFVGVAPPPRTGVP
jgi:hypothetical protein